MHELRDELALTFIKRVLEIAPTAAFTIATDMRDLGADAYTFADLVLIERDRK